MPLSSMVDLHSLSVKDAQITVNYWLSASASQGISKIRFVTGRGNHLNAKGDRGTLYKSFLNWIEQSPFKERVERCDQQDGYFEIYFKVVHNQPYSLNDFFKSVADQYLDSNLEMIKTKAEAGEVNFQLLYAQLLEEGKKVKQDFKQAAKFYEKASNNQYPPAMQELARCYFQGVGVRQNDHLALKWLEKADQLNHIESTVSLGNSYWLGYGIPVDAKTAVSYYAKAAKQEHPVAMRKLASAYRQGVGLTQDLKKSFEWYKKSADLGDIISQYNVGAMYQKGSGVESNQEEAWRYLYKAAEGGDPEAQCTIGFYYFMGKFVEKDESLALSWLQKAASNGSKQAIHQLSLIGDEQSKKEFLKKSAATGNVIDKMRLHLENGKLDNLSKEQHQELLFKELESAASLSFTDFYLLDHNHKFLLLDWMLTMGSKQQQKKALHTIKIMGEEKDCIFSLRRLFLLYRGNFDILPNPDMKKAIESLQTAINLDDSKSMVILGYFYDHGKNVTQSKQKAFSLYEQASKLNNPTACYNMALFYYNGSDIPQDLAKAYQYATAAVELEHTQKTTIPLNSGIVDEYESIGKEASIILTNLKDLIITEAKSFHSIEQTSVKTDVKSIEISFDQYKNQANIYFEDKQYQKAYQMWILAIGLIEGLSLTTLKKQNYIFILNNNLAARCQQLENYTKAITHFQQSLESCAKGSKCYETILQKKIFCEKKLKANNNNEQAIVLYQQGKWQEALSLFQGVLEVNQELFRDKPHEDIAKAYWSISSCYLKLNELEEAKFAVLQTYEMRKDLLGEHHEQTQKTLVRLQQLIGSVKNSQDTSLANLSQTL